MKTIIHILKVVVFFVLSTHFALASVSDRGTFAQALIGKNNPQKEEAMAWIVENESELIAKSVLTAWLEGDLYYVKDKKSEQYQALYISDNIKKSPTAKSAWDDTTMAVESSRQFSKVRVNNRLRGKIRLEIASLGLSNPEASIRLSAVTAFLGTTDDTVMERLQQRKTVEQDEGVLNILNLALAIDQSLTGDKSSDKVAAIETLSGYKQSVVLQTLNKIISKDKDELVVAAAERALDSYQQSQKFYSGVETVFFGLSLGSVLVLAGIGLAITFGVMGVINMAHGELIMIGAYTTYVMQQLIDRKSVV